MKNPARHMERKVLMHYEMYPLKPLLNNLKHSRSRMEFNFLSEMRDLQGLALFKSKTNRTGYSILYRGKVIKFRVAKEWAFAIKSDILRKLFKEN